MKKVDANHGEIVKGLRANGYSAHSTASIGKGFPDVIAASPGYCVLFEIKNPKVIPSQRRLTIAEELFRATWRGPLFTIHTLEEALEILTNKR